MNTCSKGRAIKRARRATGRAEHSEEVTDPRAGTEAWADLQEREICFVTRTVLIDIYGQTKLLSKLHYLLLCHSC